MTAQRFQMHELSFSRSLDRHDDTAFTSQVRRFSRLKHRKLGRSISTTIVAIEHAKTLNEKKIKLLMVPVDIDSVDDNRQRSKALTALPNIDSNTGKMNPTVCCFGCASLPCSSVGSERSSLLRRSTPRNASSNFRKEFARSDYLKHFKECPAASQYWNVAKQSLVLPECMVQTVSHHVRALRELRGCPVLSMHD
jgi:hypothetical protein